jgi:hypothetical protein
LTEWHEVCYTLYVILSYMPFYLNSIRVCMYGVLAEWHEV